MGAFTLDEIRHELGYPPFGAIDTETGIGPESAGEDEILINAPKVAPVQAFDSRVPGAAHSNKPAERDDNARVNNAEQQRDSKKSVSNGQTFPYPFGAIPVEPALLDQKLKENYEALMREKDLIAHRSLQNTFDLNTDPKPIVPGRPNPNPKRGTKPKGEKTSPKKDSSQNVLAGDCNE
jgi:hypothetical protein